MRAQPRSKRHTDTDRNTDTNRNTERNTERNTDRNFPRVTMRSCCVVNCTNRSENGWRMFNIPRGRHPFAQNRRRLWLEAVKRADWGSSGTAGGVSVCAAHFISGEPSMDCNSPDFVPSVFPAKVTRIRRRQKKAPVSLSTFHTDTEDEDESDFVPKLNLDQLSIQCDQLQEDYEALKRELEAVKSENQQLQDQLKLSKFGFDSLKDSTLCFFTGLESIQVFSWLLNIIKRTGLVLKDGLNWENHLLLVLMKIRLGLDNKDLAQRFDLPSATVSKIIREWIPMLSLVLKPLIIWPSKNAVTANMPTCFKPKFENCRCVIDCTEICIKRIYNRKAGAETQNYKQQNTVKYLIGITPAGAICFLSGGLDGRASDKITTLGSGFLEKLESGDEVLADPRFLVGEELASVGAKLTTLSFTKGKRQMFGSCVDSSRRLWRVRQHVGRVMGHLKDFNILNTVMPSSSVGVLDDVVTVCAGLVNLRSTGLRK
ncbi:uncharacterized protein LOC110166720 isoform X2 [Boleophthalmus pectinirostris]|uniref:uncharacterized protein LOC110166720 isoform X2 n=1 Tax=Boleophthalmus pectinirostris TaxID=150288 RepID=UPI00242D35FD|nr:uncharacterized protein LOC110166720 isoform X2 [Boleophthalmus pectinirostris]